MNCLEICNWSCIKILSDRQSQNVFALICGKIAKNLEKALYHNVQKCF